MLCAEDSAGEQGDDIELYWGEGAAAAEKLLSTTEDEKWWRFMRMFRMFFFCIHGVKLPII